MKSVYFALFLTLISATALRAADINITADNRVEWHQKSKKMVASGNAVASKDGLTVKADTLTGFYTEKSGAAGSGISRVIANGNVRMETPKAKAFGNNLDYDLTKDEAVLTGAPSKIDTGTEVITAEDKITYYPKEQKAIALGNVTATDKSKNKLYADKMVAEFAKENNKSENMVLKKVNIFGNVKIVNEETTVTADKGSYQPEIGVVRLFDNVVINQQGNVLHGDKAETNLKTGISKLLSTSSKNKVKGVFKEKK